MSAAAGEGFGGGVGGKFRKRPFRKTPATPYDRPPPATRGIRGNAVEAAAAGGRHGWLSKLVDPASRLITRGATRFFASVFQKRLGAPPPAEAPVVNFEPRQEAVDVADANPVPEISEQGNKDDRKSRNISDDDGISELEQLLKQKTFTRAELDHLTELLRSRTVDLAEEDAKHGIEPRTFLPAADCKKKEVEFASGQENGVENLKISSTPGATLMIPGEEIASPAEIAKAYMGSKPPRISLASSLRIQTTREATASPRFVGFAPKSSAEPVGSKSVSQSSGVRAYFENGCMTQKARGRSAIYKMSRSPYVRSQQSIILKGSELHDDGCHAPSTSNEWTPTNLAFSSGKQALKRRSSILENDIGSFGPIRRIRQKSNLASPSKDVTSLFPGKFLPPANTVDNVETFSLMPLPWHEPKYATSHLKAAGTGDEKSSHASVPPQSSKMARKILQQLDKLVPSPEEKSSELKAISRHESPPKLTVDMLHGQALKSVSEIDSSKIFNVKTNGKLEGPDYLPPGSSISPKQKKVEDGPSISGTKIASEAKGVDGVLVYGKDKFPVKGPLDSTFRSSAACPSHKKPAFTMQAPEDLLELEDDNNSSSYASGPSATGKEKLKAPDREPMVAVSETAVAKKPFPFSAGSKPAFDLTVSKEAGKGVTDRPAVSGQDTGFTFRVSSLQSQPPPTPTMLSPAVEKSVPSEQNNVPIFTFSSKTTPLTFSSSVMSSIEPSSLKSEAKSDSKGQFFGSMTTSTIMTTSVESESGKAGETQKPGDSFKSVGAMSSLGLMTSSISNNFSFVTSATSSQSNGSLTTTSSMFSVSATPAVSPSGSSAGSIVSTNSASTSSSASISPSAFPAVALFQFGSSSAVSTDSVSSAVKYGSTNLELKTVKESPFGIFSSAVVTSSSIGSSIFGFGASASSSSASGTVGSISRTQETQYGGGTSPFAQSMTSQLGPSSSPAFGLGGSSLGFSSSAFGSLASSAKPFGSSFGLASGCTTSSPSSAPSTSFAPSVTSASLFGLSSLSATSSIFGSSSSPSTMFSSASSSSASATMSFSSSSSSPLTFTSSAAATSSAFNFSQATTTSSSVLPFTSFGATTSSIPLSLSAPAFGTTPTVSLGSGSPGNDQMNVEDSMADDTVQPVMPSFPTFGQPSIVSAPNLPFGSPAPQLGAAPIFQFASPQPSAFPQTPFQATGSFEIGGAGFSMGSGGVERSGRKYIKAKRDKHRKK